MTLKIKMEELKEKWNYICFIFRMSSGSDNLLSVNSDRYLSDLSDSR